MGKIHVQIKFKIDKLNVKVRKTSVFLIIASDSQQTGKKIHYI